MVHLDLDGRGHHVLASIQGFVEPTLWATAALGPARSPSIKIGSRRSTLVLVRLKRRRGSRYTPVVSGCCSASTSGYRTPQSLVAAMGLAYQFELQEQYTASAPRASPNPRLLSPAAHLALPAPPSAKAATSATITVEGLPIKRLTQAEQEECRHLGLYCNCDEKFTRDHNRVCKRLFLLDGFEEEDGAATETVEDVGLRTPGPSQGRINDTMQLGVELGFASLVALLDSGSTYNFILEAATLRTRLPLQHQPASRLWSPTANASCALASSVTFRLQSVAPCSPLISMSCLWRYDVVLGTRWLAMLGPIVWDFSNRAVSFTYQNHAFCWQWLASPRALVMSTTTASSSFLEELLVDFDDVFDELHNLPPSRSRDHSITLVPRAPPVAVRPYQYPVCTRTNWSVNVRPCWTRGLFSAASLRSHPWASSRRWTDLGGSKSTTVR